MELTQGSESPDLLQCAQPARRSPRMAPHNRGAAKYWPTPKAERHAPASQRISHSTATNPSFPDCRSLSSLGSASPGPRSGLRVTRHQGRESKEGRRERAQEARDMGTHSLWGSAGRSPGERGTRILSLLRLRSGPVSGE